MIESVANKTYKLIGKLELKKYRDKNSLFKIESRKLVDEAIASSANIDFIFLKEGVDYKSDIKTIVLKKDLFDKITSMKSPDGIGAVVKKPEAKKLTSARVLLLDKINDPGNIGTMIRSAEAFGFKDIILSPETVDIYNEKSLRASMGSVFRLNIVKLSKDEIISLKKSYKFISADMDGRDIRTYEPKGSLVLAIGNEANGLSSYIRDLTDDFVKIKMLGEIESLNAAIAASIIMNKLML